MKVVRSLDIKTWSDFVNRHPHSNIFHTPEMFEVFANTDGYEPNLWAVLDNKNTVQVLLLPVKNILMGSLMRYFTTRSIVYGGILCALNSTIQLKALDILLQTYCQQSHISLFTELRNSADIRTLQPALQQHKFEFIDYNNYLVNLNLTEEQVFNNISKSTRKNIRKALRKEALIIEEIDSLEKLKVWYTLIQKTYTNSQIPLADYSLFKSTFNILYPKGMVQFLIGSVEGTHVAASVALLYKKVIYGWYRGFDRKYGNYLPNDLMVWHLLKWGIENGYHIFDFGGAGKPDEDYGPRRFKAKFGGELVNYGRNTYIHSTPKLKISEFAYEIYRRYLLSYIKKR